MNDITDATKRQREAAVKRRAEALRANLRRRKEQGRARSGEPVPVAPVLEFWFGAPGDPGRDQFRPCWFTKDPDYDAAIAARFGSAVQAALDGAWTGAVTSPDEALALVILLDQFPRNIFRGTAKAFAGDPMAYAMSTQATAAGWDRAMSGVERLFLYMPVVHSEDLADQDRAVALMASLPDAPWYADSLASAERHRDVIRRFGRYPHRNAALGRVSSPDELAYLATPGAGF